LNGIGDRHFALIKQNRHQQQCAEKRCSALLLERGAGECAIAITHSGHTLASLSSAAISGRLFSRWIALLN
jgi:hypothetical protein